MPGVRRLQVGPNAGSVGRSAAFGASTGSAEDYGFPTVTLPT